MDEPRAQTQRVAIETGRRMKETASEARRRMQESAQEATKTVTKLAERGAQTTAALTEANQRVLNEFMGLSMETVQETARIFMQMQRSAIDMLRAGQAAVGCRWRADAGSSDSLRRRAAGGGETTSTQ